jgi:hypothetical protein
MSRLSYHLLAAAAVIALAAPTMAQEAPDPDTTSQGQSTIKLTIPELVQIVGVGDIELGQLNDLTDDVTEDDGVCVFSNAGGNRGYTVTATGNGGTASTDFTVKNGQAELTYSVRFYEGTTAGGATPLTSGSPSEVLSGGTTIYEADQCTTPDATFDVTFTAEDLQAAPAGAYEGTLTLLVSPAAGEGGV